MNGHGFAGAMGLGRVNDDVNSFGAIYEPVTDYFEALTDGIIDTHEPFETKNIINRYQEPDRIHGLTRYQGPISLPVQAEAIGHFLAGVLGVSSTTEVASGFLYTTQFTPREQGNDINTKTPLPSYTLESFRDVTSSVLYGGVVFPKLTLEQEINAALVANVDAIAKTSAVGTATTPSFPGSPVDAFYFDSCSISYDGAGTALVEQVGLEIDSQVSGIPTLNTSKEIDKYRKDGFTMMRLSGTSAFENLTDLNRFRNETLMALRLHWFSAASFSMLIDMPQVKYTAYENTNPGRERLTAGWEADIQYKATSATALSISVTNNRSGYHV